MIRELKILLTVTVAALLTVGPAELVVVSQ